MVLKIKPLGRSQDWKSYVVIHEEVCIILSDLLLNLLHKKVIDKKTLLFRKKLLLKMFLLLNMHNREYFESCNQFQPNLVM